MGDEENLRTQRNRVGKLVGEITPHGHVEFDAQTSNRITFRISVPDSCNLDRSLEI
jgi:hypothetical protein